MTEAARPRAFISYRHAEFPDNEQANLRHREWIGRLADDLAARNIQIIWDHDIRKVVSKHCTIDPFEVPLCKEISRAIPAVCDAFIPILTPAYLERVGIVNGRKVHSSIPYGVVFEEWQGGGHLAQKGRLSMIPVIRRGVSPQIPLAWLGSLCDLPVGVIDLRQDDPIDYARQVDRIAIFLREKRGPGNLFSSIELQSWCDLYVEWCRVQFPGRLHTPVDTWYFHTGAANEFMGAFGDYLRDGAYESDDMCGVVEEWRKALRLQSESSSRALQYAHLVEMIALAIQGLSGDAGWQHLQRCADFSASALQSVDIQGDSAKRAQAFHNAAAAFLRLFERERKAVLLNAALHHIQRGLEGISPETHEEVWKRLQARLSEAQKFKSGAT